MDGQVAYCRVHLNAAVRIGEPPIHRRERDLLPQLHESVALTLSISRVMHPKAAAHQLITAAIRR